MNRLAIVIVSYNARDDLVRTLESLTNAPPTTSHEIVVVDNASSDDSLVRAADSLTRVSLVRLKENVGFAKANNRTNPGRGNAPGCRAKRRRR